MKIVLTKTMMTKQNVVQWILLATVRFVLKNVAGEIILILAICGKVILGAKIEHMIQKKLHIIMQSQLNRFMNNK